jgi:hypothetical protein
MDHVVHGDEPSSGCDEPREGVPGVKEHGHVVVPVEEDELLLPEDDENGVSELRDFRQDEHPCPESADPVVFDKAEKITKISSG